MNVQKLKTMKKTEIVEWAMNYLKKDKFEKIPEFYFSDISKASVMAGSHLADDKETYTITFPSPYKTKYAPLKSSYKTDVFVSVIEDEIITGNNCISNPQDYTGGPDEDYYEPLENSKEIINFVRESLKKGAEYPPSSFTIYERSDHYYIINYNREGEWSCMVKKGSGKVEGEMHAHSEPDGLNEVTE